MANIDFGGVMEEVITLEEFSLEKAREILKDETIAILGYGVQGPAQALNLRDNGFSPIIGQLDGNEYWELLHLIEMKPNRLMIFDGRCFHSQYIQPQHYAEAFRVNQILYLTQGQ